MITYRKLQIKNSPGLFFDSITNIKGLDIALVSVNQISFINENRVNYEIEYYGNYVNSYPLHLVFNDVDVYFSCFNEEKYLVFALTDKNKEMLENYKELWDKIKKEIRTIKGGIEPSEFEKDVMKIRFESDNRLPLNKIMNVPVCVIIARSVFEKIDEFYPQVYLYSCCLKYDANDDENTYAYCKKLINNSEYGKYLFKKTHS